MSKNKYGGIMDKPGWSTTRGNYDKLKRSIYLTWYEMLRRVHDPKRLASRPTYIGSTIEPSWYTFSNFVSDFKLLPGYSDYALALGKGYALDKDSIVPGNKHYGPTTCSLITVAENSSECARRCNPKPVKAISLTNPQDIRVYTSATDAEKDGFLSDAVSRCCRGKQKRYKGYKWEYI